ncbi:hypothetical protein TNIN_107091 [Trichonephila inaurata madagascariensis]|uniref:Secreted protein n=1 Tax=Trichonephila inaurata madagascariensis TaxID=2747483 RepID=A0A8X7CQF5_9ARAC|nr:hypothetical protein TNIN_107091 [Trichonephila inaurata madagascariensis]
MPDSFSSFFLFFFFTFLLFSLSLPPFTCPITTQALSRLNGSKRLLDKKECGGKGGSVTVTGDPGMGPWVSGEINKGIKMPKRGVDGMRGSLKPCQQWRLMAFDRYIYSRLISSSVGDWYH